MRKSNALRKTILSSIGIFAMGVTQVAYSEITWNGFLSAGGGIANPDEGDVLGEGEGVYGEDFTFDNNTKIGLQLTAPLSDKLSATGQMLARGTDDYVVEMAWAYLSYEATDSTTLRLGRFRTPFYLYSDFLDVGYAYHWITPPDDVYTSPTESVDGFDIVHTSTIGASDLTTQFYGGSAQNTDDVGSGVDTDVRNLAGLAFTLNYNWLTLRASHHEAQKVSLIGLENSFVADGIGAISDLQASLRALGVLTGDAGYGFAADNLSVIDAKFTFDELALKVDWNNILFVTEVTELDPESGPIGTQERLFATLGYTMGDFMVHVTHVETKDEIANIASFIPTDIPTLEATSVLLATVVDGIATGFNSPDRTTDSIGLRWDFDTNVALKVEYMQIDDAGGDDGDIFRFVVDLVF